MPHARSSEKNKSKTNFEFASLCYKLCWCCFAAKMQCTWYIQKNSSCVRVCECWAALGYLFHSNFRPQGTCSILITPQRKDSLCSLRCLERGEKKVKKKIWMWRKSQRWIISDDDQVKWNELFKRSVNKHFHKRHDRDSTQVWRLFSYIFKLENCQKMKKLHFHFPSPLYVCLSLEDWVYFFFFVERKKGIKLVFELSEIFSKFSLNFPKFSFQIFQLKYNFLQIQLLMSNFPQ